MIERLQMTRRLGLGVASSGLLITRNLSVHINNILSIDVLETTNSRTGIAMPESNKKVI